MSNAKLTLEILSGPLDGQTITIEREMVWGSQGAGLLVFPWDTELDARQARFFWAEGCWWIESYPAQCSTYRFNREKRIEGSERLEPGDILKASETWLLVQQIG